MSVSAIIFYLLSAAIIGGAFMAVTSLKIFRAAIYLLFCLMGIAGVYFYLHYEFIAAVQIVVYVGGIVVLLIFSIFLTHESGADMKPPIKQRSIFAVIATLCAFALIYVIVNKQQFVPSPAPSINADVNEIGTEMLSTTAHGYILPFEVISVLLLAAMIGAIVIAIKVKPKE
ncbi:MAG: NADH-quinone oxidoreductase subunit J [Bacteroidetes bacterium]|nr:NADH-quinone oxidoreductase subunit J [Bacteroidota bacterium]